MRRLRRKSRKLPRSEALLLSSYIINRSPFVALKTFVVLLIRQTATDSGISTSKVSCNTFHNQSLQPFQYFYLLPVVQLKIMLFVYSYGLSQNCIFFGSCPGTHKSCKLDDIWSRIIGAISSFIGYAILLLHNLWQLQRRLKMDELAVKNIFTLNSRHTLHYDRKYQLVYYAPSPII